MVEFKIKSGDKLGIKIEDVNESPVESSKPVFFENDSEKRDKHICRQCCINLALNYCIFKEMKDITHNGLLELAELFEKWIYR